MKLDPKLAAVLKKKWVRVGLMVIAGLGLVYILRARLAGGAQQSASGLSDAQAANMTQLAEQSNAITAQQQAQASSIAASSAAQTEQDNTTLAGMKIQYGTQLAGLQDTNATQLAGLQATNAMQLAGLKDNNATQLADLQDTNATQLAGLKDNNATSITELNSNNQTHIALAGVQEQGLESQLNAQTTQQSDALHAQVSLSNISANTATTLSANSTAAQIAAQQAEQAIATTASTNQMNAAIAGDQAQVGIAQANNSGGGLCFITTAVCERQDLADDCDTLKLLRQFRDSFVLSQANGAELVTLYYASAPLIMRRINEMPSLARDTLLGELESMIERAVVYINQGLYRQAQRQYEKLFMYTLMAAQRSPDSATLKA